MQKNRNLSYPLSLLLSAVITIVIFLLMYQLIHTDVDRHQLLETIKLVDITPAEQEEKPEEEEPEPEEPPEEPLLPELALSTPVPSPKIQVDIPPMALDVGDFDIRASGNWSPPAPTEIATGAPEQGSGRGNSGFRIVEPLGSRQPNIPEIAWENKIDGWVLVSFIVYNNGRVGKVRVMDSFPRGVFEEEVIAAVSNWLYEAFQGPPIQLTQKIELFWKNYPYNIKQHY